MPMETLRDRAMLSRRHIQSLPASCLAIRAAGQDRWAFIAIDHPCDLQTHHLDLRVRWQQSYPKGNKNNKAFDCPPPIYAMERCTNTTWRRNMKMLATTIGLAVSIALATLIAANPASARSYWHHGARHFRSHDAALGRGYYIGESQFKVDRSDRASSPFAGGGGK
jgi:hypothetical protein